VPPLPEETRAQELAGLEAQYSATLRARYAGRLVNELAQQLEWMGDDAPEQLRQQYESEIERTEHLLGDSEEGW
jgi:hypothetical protein